MAARPGRRGRPARRRHRELTAPGPVTVCRHRPRRCIGQVPAGCRDGPVSRRRTSGRSTPPPTPSGVRRTGIPRGTRTGSAGSRRRGSAPASPPGRWSASRSGGNRSSRPCPIVADARGAGGVGARTGGRAGRPSAASQEARRHGPGLAGPGLCSPEQARSAPAGCVRQVDRVPGPRWRRCSVETRGTGCGHRADHEAAAQVG